MSLTKKKKKKTFEQKHVIYKTTIRYRAINKPSQILKFRLVHLILFRTQVELELIIKQDYTSKFSSFTCCKFKIVHELLD